ncbi:MAG: hypothetical protein IJV17_05600 [Prevotella sp.]|nr:hypothetical protein [Prevotella sp.]
MVRLIITILLLLTTVLSVNAQSLDERHLLLDGSLSDEEVAARPFVFNNLREAVNHFSDTTTLYIKPWVYWVDNPDHPEVVTGKNGREPFGMVIHAQKLDLIGLCQDAREVVFASQRGQTQGAVGNFTMFDFHVDYLRVENLTMGNYCNVDLDYPYRPVLSRRKRSETITQAHVGYVHGESLTAKNVRFISRLNLNPLNGAHQSTYEDCHFECTDDALNGHAVYRHCDFDFYGTKPLWSTYGQGAMFIDCDFFLKNKSAEAYFCKQGGPVTVVDSRFHAPSDSVYLGWTAYPQPWLRCYQRQFTLNGRPYTIGHRQSQNTIIVDHKDASLFEQIPYLDINCHEKTLRTGGDALILVCRDSAPVQWHVQQGAEGMVSLVPIGKDSVRVIPTNNSDETADFCVMATAGDGRETVCHLRVLPSELPPPVFLRQPTIMMRGSEAVVDYSLDLQGHHDESLIEWLRSRDHDQYAVVATSHTTPSRTYQLGAADAGKWLKARIRPKHHRSDYGPAAEVQWQVPASTKTFSREYHTDFHDFPCDWQPLLQEGLWTVDGYKPTDTVEFDWSFDSTKPMWEYGKGFNGAVGMGLLQHQRGARLRYTPAAGTYGDMSLVLEVDPTKTAGQGFGSATGQYMDVCLKFDTKTLTGYGLRIIRTTKHAKAVDFLLVAYDHGTVIPLTEPVSSTCYRTGCSISLHFIGNRLTAHVETKMPQPEGSDLPHMVDLQATVIPNSYGGIHIQHTGSCGESTTMLHQLHVRW